MKKILAKLLGLKTFDDYVKKCVIKPKYAKKS